MAKPCIYCVLLKVAACFHWQSIIVDVTYGLWRLTGPPPQSPLVLFCAFSLLLWFRLSNKAHKSTNTLLFRSNCCGFVCSTKHQKAQYLALACKYVSAQCHSVVYSPRRSPHSSCISCFWCFFGIALVSSVPQSTSTLLFRAICCGFVCSTKHQNVQNCFFDHIFLAQCHNVVCSPFCVLELF